ncbi:hypothetical protein KR074_001144, partial [Drosophila pseudoananassae]
MNSILSLVSCVFCFCASAYALVHYIKLEKGANGCKTPQGVDFKVGAYEQDENVCGAYTCQSENGDALIHYCQRPVTFAECNDTGVSTGTDFPQCCWTCVRYVECEDSSGNSSSSGSGSGSASSSGSSSSASSSGGSSGGEPAGDAPAERTKGLFSKTKGSEDDSDDIKHDGEAEYAKLVDSKENIKFGGGTPLTKFGESSR